MHERIKELRKALNLTQREFADKICISRGALATYEIGRNEPIDAVISLICREFNASETWLRTGKGEMFQPTPNGALDAFIRERNLSPADRILIDKFAALDTASRQMVVDYVLSVADEIQETPAASDTPISTVTNMDIAAKLAEMEQQNKKLLARLEVLEKEEEEKERRHTKQSVSPARSHTQ